MSTTPLSEPGVSTDTARMAEQPDTARQVGPGDQAPGPDPARLAASLRDSAFDHDSGALRTRLPVPVRGGIKAIKFIASLSMPDQIPCGSYVLGLVASGVLKPVPKGGDMDLVCMWSALCGGRIALDGEDGYKKLAHAVAQDFACGNPLPPICQFVNPEATRVFIDADIEAPRREDLPTPGTLMRATAVLQREMARWFPDLASEARAALPEAMADHPCTLSLVMSRQRQKTRPGKPAVWKQGVHWVWSGGAALDDIKLLVLNLQAALESHVPLASGATPWSDAIDMGPYKPRGSLRWFGGKGEQIPHADTVGVKMSNLVEAKGRYFKCQARDDWYMLACRMDIAGRVLGNDACGIVNGLPTAATWEAMNIRAPGGLALRVDKAAMPPGSLTPTEDTAGMKDGQRVTDLTTAQMAVLQRYVDTISATAGTGELRITGVVYLPARATATTKKFIISVSGPGAHKCPNKATPHSSSTVYFIWTQSPRQSSMRIACRHKGSASAGAKRKSATVSLSDIARESSTCVYKMGKPCDKVEARLWPSMTMSASDAMQLSDNVSSQLKDNFARHVEKEVGSGALSCVAVKSVGGGAGGLIQKAGVKRARLPGTA